MACAPGTAFGRAGEGYLRLSYANSVENLEAALAAIAAFVERLADRAPAGASTPVS